MKSISFDELNEIIEMHNAIEGTMGETLQMNSKAYVEKIDEIADKNGILRSPLWHIIDGTIGTFGFFEENDNKIDKLVEILKICNIEVI